MLKKSLAVSFAGLGLTMVAAGTASATITTAPSSGFGGSTVAVTGDQSGILTVNSPLVDLRCATPWYGSAVLGGSTPIGQQNVTCDDVKTPVTEVQSWSKNGVLN
jgi:hypothetical protein